jgi:hypothetical protein
MDINGTRLTLLSSVVELNAVGEQQFAKPLYFRRRRTIQDGVQPAVAR